MNKSKDTNTKSQRIQVFARCRPLNNIEKKQNSPSIVEVIPEKKKIVLKDKNHNREFFFDKVFPTDSEQITVYKAVVAPLIQEVLNGYNCTVFAYGQTGTGKTYTMEGGERGDSTCSWEEDPAAGIIPRSLHQLFDMLNKQEEEENIDFTVCASFLELYNEEIYDLLSVTELSRLRIYEDSSKKKPLIIDGLEEAKVRSKDDVYSILEKGRARRQTAATLLNATSSRSHTVFSVTVHMKENTIEGEELIKTGKLNLVDLAGSENVGRSGAVDKRAREAGNINQSLLTLGRVITALIEKQQYVPYRASKLTRLLRDSLGGHTKTSIIVTISPALCNFEETLSTLDFGTKSKSITTRPEVNQKMTKRALIREYADEIDKLRKDLSALRSKEGFFVDFENYNNMVADLTKKTDIITDLSDKNSLLSEENMKIEQDFNAVKAELAEIKEELHVATKKYEETASELVKKISALNITRKILSERTLQRDEKQFIVNAHSNTEKKLTQQAQQLLSVADTTTGDVEKLHAKIDRKQLVDKTNDEKLHNFHVMCHQQFSKLDAMVTNTESDQMGYFQEMKTDLDILESGLKCYQSQTSSVLKNVLSHYVSDVSHITTRLESQNEAQIQMENSLLQEIIDKKTAQLERQTLFMNGTFPQLIHNLNQMNNEMIAWFFQVHQQLLQKIDIQKSIVDLRTNTQRSLLTSIQESLSLFYTQHEELLQSLHERTSKLSTAQDNLEKDLVKAFESFLKNIKEAKEDTSKLEETHANLKRPVTELKAAENPLQELLQTIDNTFEDDTKCLSDLSGVMDINKVTDVKESLGHANENISAGIAKFYNENEEIEKSNMQEIKSKIDLHTSTILENTQIMKSDLERMKCSIEVTVQNEELHLHKKNDELQDCVIKTSNIVLESENRLGNSTTGLKEEITKRDIELGNFVSSEIVHDVPTGTTPQRKNYDYPKVLAATSPESRLLQRFYSQLENSTAINLPLDSSFDENEESKHSPSFTNSGTSDSVTSTLDDADSYASSVSDAGEEKENRRCKKKSKLPKKVPSSKLLKGNDFVIPATPPKKKPFCSSYSSSENVI